MILSDADRAVTRLPYADGLPQCRLILHHDAAHEMSFVTDSLRLDLPVSTTNAWRLMLIAHHFGKSLVFTAHRELVELYHDKLRSRGLNVTIEPDA